MKRRNFFVSCLGIAGVVVGVKKAQGSDEKESDGTPLVSCNCRKDSNWLGILVTVEPDSVDGYRCDRYQCINCGWVEIWEYRHDSKGFRILRQWQESKLPTMRLKRIRESNKRSRDWDRYYAKQQVIYAKKEAAKLARIARIEKGEPNAFD